MKQALIAAALLTLTGCASSSGVVQMGNDQFFVSKQAASGFTGMATLRADALKEAYAVCSKAGRAVQVVHTTESQPPFVFGNFPRVDITFRCVAEQ